jgi:hypothetical protein
VHEREEPVATWTCQLSALGVSARGTGATKKAGSLTLRGYGYTGRPAWQVFSKLGRKVDMLCASLVRLAFFCSAFVFYVGCVLRCRFALQTVPPHEHVFQDRLPGGAAIPKTP